MVGDHLHRGDPRRGRVGDGDRLARSAPAGQAVPEAAAIAQATPDVDSRSGQPVLIIDDDASICELMRRNLGEEGYRTESAATGEEGLRLAKQLLPRRSSSTWSCRASTAGRCWRPEDGRPDVSIPIIMASMLDEKERGLRAGADEYLSKPFSGGRLADLLHKHIGTGHGPAAGREDDPTLACASLGAFARKLGGDEAADAEEAWRLAESPGRHPAGPDAPGSRRPRRDRRVRGTRLAVRSRSSSSPPPNSTPRPAGGSAARSRRSSSRT